MAAGDILIVPAQAAGFIRLQGRIAKNSAGDLIDIPAGMVNIGGNGAGYLLAAQAGLSPTAAANHDGSVTALTLGDDIYIYACKHTSGYAKIVFSKNASVPNGYTAGTSRKIGGFHVGRIRPIEQRFSASFTPTVGIVPNSVWDALNRPRVSPEGMAEFAPGKWGSIYLLSVVSGSWPNVVFGSRFGAQPVRSTGGYNELDLHRGLHACGMREPTFEEWLMMAYGAPAGADGNNDTAWTATSNTGPCNTGAVSKSVSCANFVDCVGNLWERLRHHFDIGSSTNTYAWDATVVNTGQDAAFSRGQVNHVAWRHAVAGGYWASGAYCGARTLSLLASPWNALGHVGVRGVSDAL
ncbi:MAG: hypothetical protein N2690_02660 [Rhodocyclaceae bacterium]|nr:hypothetical protein [Rhodocyclaceae bacterium]